MMLGKKSIQYKEVNGKVAFIIKFKCRFTFFYGSVIRGQVKLFIFQKTASIYIEDNRRAFTLSTLISYVLKK